MNIRLATESDITTLANLYQQTVLTHAQKHYTPEQAAAWASLAGETETFRAFILKATTFVAIDSTGDATGILGFAGIANDGHITATYVRHDALHQGIGSKLMERILDYATGRQIARLYAEANPFSLGLFKKFGFQLYATETVNRQGVEFQRSLVELELN